MAALRRHRTLWDATIGLVATLLVFGAVPGVLIGFVGLPVPRHWSAAVVSWHGLFDLLAIVSWCAWAACAWPVLRRAAARVRARDVAGAVRLSDRIALRIAIGVLAFSSLLGAGTSVASGAVTGGSTVRAAHVQRTAEPARVAPFPRDDQPTGAVPLGARSAPAAASFWSAGTLLPLAELSAAGMSALVAGLLARRARQLRRLQAFLREEGDETPEPGDEEADLAALVASFEALPLPAMIEAASRHLGSLLATLDPLPGPVRWLRAGHDGVEVRFSDPVPDVLTGWQQGNNSTWRLSAPADAISLDWTREAAHPWCPVLLPLGDDDRGTWLLPVPAGACVAVAGPRASDLVRAMRAALASWSWHEDLVVTEDPLEAAAVVDRLSIPTTGARIVCPHVLFVGTPHSLPAAVRRGCAVLATGQVDDAEVTIVVDDRGASAHPLGLTVRPPLLDGSWANAVDALIRPAVPPDRPVIRPLLHSQRVAATARLVHTGTKAPSTMPATPAPSTPIRAAPIRAAAGQPRPVPAGRAPGQAEVRLLAAVPGIVGLQGDLPLKRARRAVEIVAYLAVHAPDPVTGDRLRTRVLGSPDADAAAKTLFNTVGAARRALGVGPDGELLLPPASRTGHYRLSALVSVDAVRVWTLLHDGLASHDPAGAVALLRDGLELIESEPLGGVLTGYGWWRAEGHERRLADAVVDGACALVRQALGNGDLDLARWALVQARKVEPSCEPLTRAAMRVAAASGDARRLHAEWQECQRQIDELDPGSVPSERTEQLYALLRAQLAGDGATPQIVRA